MLATKRKIAAPSTERRGIEAIFRAYGLPGWLGWGTYGAESSYGRNGGFSFGGIDLPNSGNGNVAIEARESARAYARLLGETGSLSAAVRAYSGGSYTIAHPEALGKGTSGGEGAAVPTSWLGELGELFKLPGGLGSPSGPSLGLPGEGKGKSLPEALGGVVGGISSPFKAFSKLISTLLEAQTWLRIGEVLAGAVLVYLGLKGLSGAELPTKLGALG